MGPNGTRLLVSVFRIFGCVDCIRSEVRILDLASVHSLADASVVGGESAGCQQWPMAFLGNQIVSARNTSCGLATEELSVIDRDTGETQVLQIDQPASSLVADLNATGNRLLVVSVDEGSSTTSLASWSEDEGRSQLRRGVVAAAWIPDGSGSS